MNCFPCISQRESQNLRGSVTFAEKSNREISSLFCNDCTQTLLLPGTTINEDIVNERRDKYAQIQNLQRLLHQKKNKYDATNEPTASVNTTERNIRISDFSEETLQIYTFGFPLIQQRQLGPANLDKFNWENLKNKILKRQHRCHALKRQSVFIQMKDKLLQRNENELTKQHRKVDIPRNLESISSLTSSETKKPSTQKFLIADPKVVVFEKFEVGGHYERNVKVTNISNGKCSFQILPFHDISHFKFTWDNTKSTIAAGLSINITIQFHCQSLRHAEDRLVIKSQNGEDLVIFVKTVSEPPYLIEVVEDRLNVEEVMDSLIDCGSNFVGEESVTFLTLKNIGSAARFFFITESNWLNLELQIDPTNVLRADPFTIQPQYFRLVKSEEITLCVTATPPSSGFHTARVLLLCENGAVNHVDLECDGTLYDPSFVEHVNMLKTFDVDVKDFDIAKCYVDFGQMLSFEKDFTPLFLYNSADVSMSYHWEIRGVDLPGFSSLAETALRISPIKGRLAPYQEEMFCVEAITESVQPGNYRALLVLIIDDLPEKCVPLKYRDNLVPQKEEEDKSLRSIETKYVEVWLKCVASQISLLPYVIDFSDPPLVNGSPLQKREVVVTNEGPGMLNLTWNYPEECCPIKIKIEPSQFQCEKYSTYHCILSIEAANEGPFEISCWCILDKGDARVELKVRGLSCKPKLTPIIDHVDFGLVKLGSHQTKALVAKNCSTSDGFQWLLEELSFSEENNLFKSTNISPSLSTNGGECCHKNSEVLVNYELETHEDSLWCSVLDWDGSLIPVTADIQRPHVSLNTYTLQIDPLYVNVPSETSVKVMNHSFFSVAIFWGCLTDNDKRNILNVDVVPRCCTIESTSQVEVKIMITPREVGLLDNIYLPCFVENNAHPLLLKILGNSEGLKIKVEWNSNSQHNCVIWPNTEQHIYHPNLLKDICQCPPKVSETSVATLEPRCTVGTISNTSILKPIASNSSDVYESTEDDDQVSMISSIPYLNWPIIGGRYTRQPMVEEWETHLNNLVLLDDEHSSSNDETSKSRLKNNSLCFVDIPVKKSVTQNILVRNDTAIRSTYEASVVYNFEQSQNRTADPETMLKKIKNVCLDEYVDRADPHRGMTVFLSPEAGDLPPHDYVTISVTVVALSWGDYSDIIVLQVGDLDHLCIPLSVSVTQPPLIAPKLVRFGSVPLECRLVSRGFQIENVSTVPLYVCWDMFTPTCNELPFSVILFEGTHFSLQLTDYFGSPSSSVFKIKNLYTFVEPNSSKFVEVCFDSTGVYPNTKSDELNKTFKAMLVGHIYMTNNGLFPTNNENCVRYDGFKLPPLRVDLEVDAEVPLLSFLNVLDDQIAFKCTMFDVMKTKDKIWKSECVIKVQNKGRTELRAKVYTEGYFYISNIIYICNQSKSSNSENIIILKSGETCEVTVVCKVSESNLLELFEPDSEMTEEETFEVETSETGVICFEQRYVRQEVKLVLNIYPPLLSISTTYLDFGSVYVEDMKTLIINITATVNEESFEVYLKNGEEGPFSINKSSAVLKPNASYLLEVKFAPKDFTFYHDVLIVQSCLKSLFREIPLTGIGTFDYGVHTY